MQLQIPVIKQVDALVVADDAQGMESLSKLRSHSHEIFLAFIGAVIPEASKLQGTDKAGTSLLLEMMPIAPLLDAAQHIVGWIFLSRSGYLAIRAKAVVDATSSSLLRNQLPPGIDGIGLYMSADGNAAMAHSVATVYPITAYSHWEIQPTEEELRWHYESPRYANVSSRIPFDLAGGATEKATDVLVVGGGTSGVAAALAAAQEGVHVICVEAQGTLGGRAVDSPPTPTDHPFPSGFGQRCAIQASAGNLAEWLKQELLRLGVEIWWNTRLGGVLRSKRKITGALLVDGFGVMHLVHAKVVIDATGNALVAQAAGAPVSSLAPDASPSQGVGGTALGAIRLNAYTQGSPSCEGDTVDATRVRMQHENQNRRTGSERFRIVGDLTVQPHDIILARHYHDTIGLAHGTFATAGSEAHSLLLSLIPQATTWDAWLPLRALLPLKFDGLITTGLGISAHWDTLPILRHHPADLQNLGYASGLVASAVAKSGCPIREVPLRAIQRKLVEEGILPSDVLSVKEDENDAVLSPDRMTLYQVAVIFQRPDRARRQLQAAFEHHPTLLVAEILAFLGDSSGRDLLKQTLHDNDWEEGVPVTANSLLDCAILALRVIGGGATALVHKLQALNASSPFSHLRAVCLYFQRWPRAEAIPQLECILTTPGFAGHAGSTDNGDALKQLKELYVAGALKACSPESELATTSLSAYCNSPCLLYAVYADKLLRQN